jgi:hypothetical protein
MMQYKDKVKWTKFGITKDEYDTLSKICIDRKPGNVLEL